MCPFVQVTTRYPIEDLELVYLRKNGVPSWGRANTTTILEYDIAFADIPENR